MPNTFVTHFCEYSKHKTEPHTDGFAATDSISLDACLCDEGFYSAATAADSKTCAKCPDNMATDIGNNGCATGYTLQFCLY